MRVVSALLSTALLPLAALAAFHSNDTACTRHYTVIQGDTCDEIGAKTLTSTYQILAFNLIDAGAGCYTLEIGSQLCLGRYGNDCQFVHRCTDQDTCDSIANAYGITTETLLDNNPNVDCNTGVYDGLMVCVSAGSIRPPADNSINATEISIASAHARRAWLERRQIGTQTPTSGSSSHKSRSSNSQQQRQQASSLLVEEFEQQITIDVRSPSSVDSIDVLLNSDALSPPPLSGATSSPQKRHRSLSSRTHHQRSHTP